jgi:hypothetical protein
MTWPLVDLGLEHELFLVCAIHFFVRPGTCSQGFSTFELNDYAFALFFILHVPIMMMMMTRVGEFKWSNGF